MEFPVGLRAMLNLQVARREYFRQNILFHRLVHLKDVFTTDLPAAKRADSTLRWSLNTKEVRQLFFKLTCSLRSVSV